MAKKKRYRYELTPHPMWKGVVPLLRQISPETVLKWIKGEDIKPDGNQYHKMQRQVKQDGQSLSALSTRVKTLEDLIKEGEVDLSKWEVISYTQNFWECGSKNPSGVILPCTLYQVKAILRPIQIESKVLMDGILDEVRRLSKPVKRIIYPKGKKDLLVEICIFDFHLSKLAFDKEANNEWSLEKAEKIYDKIVNDTLSRVDVSRIDRFVLPVGNDLLDYDNPSNTTTRGTQMAGPDHWDRLVLFAFQMLKRNIEKLSLIAPVYVPVILGNHSELSMFSIGAMLDAVFSENKNITIDNAKRKRKCHHFGMCLIAWCHGHRLKARDMHALMSTEWPELFGKTKYRAWHKAHLHKNSKQRAVFQDVKDEYQGVDIETCPSITITDLWHYMQGYYGNIRRSKSYIWHYDNGLQQELYYNL